MTRTKKAFILGILLIAGLSLHVLAVDISGTWVLTSQSSKEESTFEIFIEQDGNKITVTRENPLTGEEWTGKGKVKDRDVEWTFTLNTPKGAFTATYKGTVENGSMSGKVSVDSMFTTDWTAEKK